MEKTLTFIGLLLFTNASIGHVYNAIETETFAIPISPNLFNWTYQEFDQQYRFHASLIGKPELPSWLRYIYSGRHHSGFIFGTPPRNTASPIAMEVVGLNRQNYETRRVLLILTVEPKAQMAAHEVELKIDNLNVEDLLDEHRMKRLKDILRTKLWTESSQDLYTTFLASAIDLGARLPLRPSDGDGLVIRLGSVSQFSTELKRLREEVRPLSKLPSCPRDYKRTTVERLFRDAGFTLDWCNFELYNTIYKARTTELLEYSKEVPAGGAAVLGGMVASGGGTLEPGRAAPRRQAVRGAGTARLVAALAFPLLLLLLCAAALSAALCVRCGRPEETTRVEVCRYGAETEATHDDSSDRSAVSPNSSLTRPHSPKSNIANYNRPQPPPYNTRDKHALASQTTLQESLQLLKQANISYDLERVADARAEDVAVPELAKCGQM